MLSTFLRTCAPEERYPQTLDHTYAALARQHLGRSHLADPT